MDHVLWKRKPTVTTERPPEAVMCSSASLLSPMSEDTSYSSDSKGCRGSQRRCVCLKPDSRPF